MEKIQTAIEKRDYPFTDADYELIHQEYRRKEEYIEECDKKLTRINIGNYKVGVSISESYRSDVGNFLSRRYKDELDFILIFNPMRESFSFRTVRDDVNCGQIAKSLTPDGGGHPQAAGMPLNSKTIFI